MYIPLFMEVTFATRHVQNLKLDEKSIETQFCLRISGDGSVYNAEFDG